MKTTPGIPQGGTVATTSGMRKKVGDSIPSGPKEKLFPTRGGTAVVLWKPQREAAAFPWQQVTFPE